MNLFPNLLSAPLTVSAITGDENKLCRMTTDSDGGYVLGDVRVGITNTGDALDVTLTADATPVRWVLLRFACSLPDSASVYGDEWERGYGTLHWGSITPEQHMPWYFLAYDAQAKEVNWSTVTSISLIVIILALLAFVILRSMRVEHETEQEEELSVESLIQSTQDADLEDIEVETKSETRKMIEKFVDDNPEAVANLLRNWLTEDWG